MDLDARSAMAKSRRKSGLTNPGLHAIIAAPAALSHVEAMRETLNEVRVMSDGGASARILIVFMTVLLIVSGSSTVGVFAQDVARPDAASPEDWAAEGAWLYRKGCARCHGLNGEGQRQGHDAAPRLSGSFARLSADEIVIRVLRGGSYMPPFGSLSDREIAAVASYVRNSFGNDLGPVAEEVVARNR